MAWTPPGNRSNQTIQRWNRILYATDTRFYSRHARVTIPKQPAQYRVGLRVLVHPANRWLSQERSTGRIIGINYYGQYPQYTIKLDNGSYTTVGESTLEPIGLMVIVSERKDAA